MLRLVVSFLTNVSAGHFLIASAGFSMAVRNFQGFLVNFLFNLTFAIIYFGFAIKVNNYLTNE